MPLIKAEYQNNFTSWGLWQITEDEALLHHYLENNANIRENVQVKRLKNKLQWYASRLLIHQMLSRLDVPFHGVEHDEYGKPRLIDCRHEIYLSISHSAGYATVCFSNNPYIGIDIQRKEEKLIRIAKKFLNQEEQSFIGTDQDKLCLAWSAKETLYKLNRKSGVNFANELLLKPFCVRKQGEIEATIDRDGKRKEILLNFERFEDHYLVKNV